MTTEPSSAPSVETSNTQDALTSAAFFVFMDVARRVRDGQRPAKRLPDDELANLGALASLLEYAYPNVRKHYEEAVAAAKTSKDATDGSNSF